jgi:alkylhydroperoxidase/carboxymuconolactone decarboxylase family protein YurZ
LSSKSLDDLRKVLAENELPVLGWAEAFYRFDPEMYESYVAWTTRARVNVELEPKVRELIAIAIDSVVMWPSPYIDVHINRAISAGATVQEIADTILESGRLMGPHSYSHGFNALDNVLKDREARGVPTPMRKSDLRDESPGL